jgi:hypothetical protein
VLAKPRFLSYCSAPSPAIPMTLSSIRAAARTERAEDWFWRFVAVGVICDFLYVSWVLVKSFRGQ